MAFVSRAGDKLDFALEQFGINVSGLICADLGCSTGGFTDCLLQKGATKVYAVDTGYGVLDYRLRQDTRVVVLERTNALYLNLPEKMDFICIDVGWTPQRLILPIAISGLKSDGHIISLLKPHYESHRANLSLAESKIISQKVIKELSVLGIKISNIITSPLLGEKGKNTEYLMLY